MRCQKVREGREGEKGGEQIFSLGEELRCWFDIVCNFLKIKEEGLGVLIEFYLGFYFFWIIGRQGFQRFQSLFLFVVVVVVFVVVVQGCQVFLVDGEGEEDLGVGVYLYLREILRQWCRESRREFVRVWGQLIRDLIYFFTELVWFFGGFLRIVFILVFY